MNNFGILFIFDQMNSVFFFCSDFPACHFGRAEIARHFFFHFFFPSFASLSLIFLCLLLTYCNTLLFYDIIRLIILIIFEDFIITLNYLWISFNKFLSYTNSNTKGVFGCWFLLVWNGMTTHSNVWFCNFTLGSHTQMDSHTIPFPKIPYPPTPKVSNSIPPIYKP